MIAREKWAKLSLMEQMGNISSDVGRAINYRDNPKLRDGFIVSAVDMLNETAHCYKGLRAQEILRARDEFLRLFYDDSDDFEAIAQYFHLFALAARNKR
jgi:hypothetical protein